MMDSLSRIAEPELKLLWPKEEKPAEPRTPVATPQPNVAWMS